MRCTDTLIGSIELITDKIKSTSRRTFIKQGAAAAAVIAAAPSIITPSSAAYNFVVVNTWGGSWTNAELMRAARSLVISRCGTAQFN